MNKKLMMFLAGALVLSSCSNDETPVTPDNVEGNHFLAVNLVAAPNAGLSRADQYEEGNEAESKVDAVRFYFFNQDGSAAAVKYNSTANYFDWTNPTADGQDLPNIESKLAATIIISSKEGDELPAQVLAVVNPSLTTLGTGAKSLDEIYALAENYASLTGTGFVMSNSVFMADGAAVKATEVPVTSYQASEDLAKHNPVNIYVERAVAKVRVNLDTDTDSELTITKITKDDKEISLIALTTEDGEPISVDGKNVYLAINGWDLTADTDKTTLGKNISTSWAANLFGSTQAWNNEMYFRSFWTTNATGATQAYHSYTDITTSGAAIGGYTYANENAPQTKATKETPNKSMFSKVILNGTLVDDGGDPIEVCKYAGQTIAGADNLKTQLLAALQLNGNIWSVNDENNGYNELTAADVEFKTALESGVLNLPQSETVKGRYYVYLQLSDTGKAKTWSTSGAEDQNTAETHFKDADAVNKYLLEQVGHAQVFKGGQTYYYFPIRHLGTSGNIGFYGVVRNHIYDCKITNIYGLGTPVYTPGETIWPEKTQDDDTYIAASINILSWRVVNSNVELNW